MKQFFDGPIINKEHGGWGDGWVTWFLLVHLLSGFAMFRIGRSLYPNNDRNALLFAYVGHLIYEIKDIAAYYEHPWFMKWNELQYNVIPRTVMSSDTFHESDPRHNYPMNSVLDQVFSMAAAWYACKYKLSNRILNMLSALWLVCLIGFNSYRMWLMRRHNTEQSTPM